MKRLLEIIAQTIFIQGQPVSLTANIGVCFFPNDGDVDVLLSHADQAMYAAKQSYKNRYYFYNPMHEQ